MCYHVAQSLAPVFMSEMVSFSAVSCVALL